MTKERFRWEAGQVVAWFKDKVGFASEAILRRSFDELDRVLDKETRRRKLPYPVELYEVIPEQCVTKWRRVKIHSFCEDSDCTVCGAFGPDTVSGEPCPGEVKK